MRIIDMSISTKLTLIALASAAAAILCVVIAFVLQDLRLVNRVKDEQIATRNALIATNLSVALNQSNHQSAFDLLRASSSEHGILAAAVFSTNHKLLITYNLPAQLIEHISVQALREYVQQQAFGFEVSLHEITVPLASGESALLVTLVSHLDVQQRIWFMAGYSVMAMVLALFIAFGISWLVQQIVTIPVRQLKDLSRRVKATGNYGLRASLSTGDELGELAQGFNAMLDQISLRDKNLEKQVQSRTRELEALAEAFRYRALHDPLTGLPNRALLTEAFYRAVAHAKRSGKYFSLVLLDVDNFKNMNDLYGHDFGDELLKEIGRHIRSAVRGEDLVCRLGGDEFVVLMGDISSETTVQVIGGNLLRDLNNELELMGKPVQVSVSIGVSLYPQHGYDLNDLKRRADIAMYCAKESGKNRLMIFQDDMELEAQHRLLVQEQLEAGIANGELEIHFQPQVNVRTNKVVAAEALVRWRKAEHELLYPADFLGYAEEQGLIGKIDCCVVEMACKQSAKWSQNYGRRLPIAVNLSGVHLYGGAIIHFLRGVLAKYNMSGSDLIVELRESIFKAQEGVALEVVKNIRELGVQIAIDDFGGTSASLLLLRQIPVDILKLDKTFARCIKQNDRDRRLTRGIVALAKECDATLVVEGVESEWQVEQMQALGCEVFQGYWQLKPCEEEKFDLWLQAFEHAA